MSEDVSAHDGGGAGRAGCARHPRRVCDSLHRAPGPLRDAQPGSLAPVYATKDGGLAEARLTRGFPLDGKPNASSIRA